MCKRIQRLLISLSMLVTLIFAQDVTLSISGDNLNYESTADIYGFQFDHDGCASGASGGDAADNGFTVSASAGTVLAFSFTGSSIPAGSGTLVTGVDCSEISGLVFSGAAGSALAAVFTGVEEPEEPACEDIGIAGFSCEEIFAFGFGCDGAFGAASIADNCPASCGGCDDEPGVELSCSGDEDVCLSLDGGDLNYVSTADIYGFQFNHDGCASGASGGDAADNGFTVSASAGTVLAFSFSGSSIPAGSGTLVTGVDCSEISGLVFSGAGGSGLVAELAVEVGDCASGVYDCNGDCDGAAVEDDCGVCNGDGTSCAGCTDSAAANYNSDATQDDGSCLYCDDQVCLTLDGDNLNYSSSEAIYGFQFDHDGCASGAGGGDSEANGFTVSASATTVLAFSFSGSSIPAGSGTLLNGVSCTIDQISGLVVSGAGGSALSAGFAVPADFCESGVFDCNGECDGTAVEDCAGECGGSAEDLGCGCGEAGPSGCDNECGSTAEVDDCGVCGGDGSSCASEFANVSYNLESDLYGFQFVVSGATLVGASGGAAEAAGFQVSASPASGVVLGFSFSGASIPAGGGTLVELEFEAGGTPCISDLVLSGAEGTDIDASIDGCLTINEVWNWDGTAQGLIDNAEDGDTVVIPCGDYDERISITQNISLVGGECEDRAQNGPVVRKGAGMNFDERQTIDVSASNINFGGESYSENLPVISVGEGVDGLLTLSGVTIDAGGSGQAAVSTGGMDLDLSDSEVQNSSGVVIDTDDCGAYDVSGNTFDGNSTNLSAGSCGVSGEGNYFGCDEGVVECGIEGDNVDFTDSSCDSDGNVLDECGECGGDGSSCAEFDCGISDLVAIGGMNEVFLQWGACEGATSYNVYRDGELIGSSPVNGYADTTQGDGFGLGYDTQYCYSVEGVNEYSTAGPASNDACATTLPVLQAFLQVNTSLANADAAAAASPFGDLTGDGVADGVIMIEMVNLLPVNGYQFNFNLNPGAVDVVAAIDGTYLMSGGMGGLTAQMSGAGSSGTVIGFDMTGQGSIPAGYPGNPAGIEGNLVAVLVVSPLLNSADTNVDVTISDFVISGQYNGQNIGLGSCDADLDPLNGCFDSDSFTTPSGAAGLSLANVTSSGADLMYASNVDIYGFQFSVSGVTLTDASSGLGETSFSASTGNVLGFDFSGSSLPAGGGLLAHIDFEQNVDGATLSISDVVLSGAVGSDISSSGPADAEVPACDDADCFGECGGSAVIDCAGVCGGDSALDDCGVCDGGNADMDCAGVCGGDAVLDCVGTCTAASTVDAWVGDGYCDDGSWGYDFVCEDFNFDNGDCDDECGVPLGDNSSCADECGVPNGDNSSCAGCDGVPNSGLELDYCGVCDGDNVANECCTVFDCEGNCAEGYESWATDGYCDDGAWGMFFNCAAWGCDDGACGEELLDDGTCGVPEDSGDGGDCVNDDSTSDAYGDTCSSWYDDYESPGSYGCSGGYDTEDFNAAEQCCACQDSREFSGDNSGEYSEHAADKFAQAKEAAIEDQIAYQEMSDQKMREVYYNNTNRDCGGTGPDVGCDGVCFSGLVDDCAGNCGGDSALDDCGVCDGGNADQDCAGVCFGDSVIDDCGVCDGGNADMDCAGVCGGDSALDDCGVCDGGNADMDDCNVCFGTCDFGYAIQSMYQAFYFFDNATLELETDINTTIDSDDKIIAFTQAGEMVGYREWNDGNTDVPVMGADPDLIFNDLSEAECEAGGGTMDGTVCTVRLCETTGTCDYMQDGETPVFKVLDVSSQTLYDAVYNVPAWHNGEAYIDLSIAVVQDCNFDLGGSADEDSCGVCSGGNSGHEADSDIDCNGDCFGTAFLDDCGVCSEGNSGHTENSDQDCAGVCFGDSYIDECGSCDADSSDDFSCLDITGVSATGGMNEVFLQWDYNPNAGSYNVYRDGELVGSSPGNVPGFIDGNQGGYGLGFDIEYCYTVTAVAASDNDGNGAFGEGADSDAACATTLPVLQAFLQLNTSLANQEVAAAASPFGDLTGDGIVDGVIMVEMVNLLPVNGYQFDFSLNPGIVDVVAAIDGTTLMTGGMAGLTAQMGANTVIGFDMTGQGSIPAGYPGNPSGVEGNLLAVLVLGSDYSDIGSEVAVTISDFVISGIYNGQNIGLGACDADLDPLNGCFDTSVFETPTADCAGIPAGDHFLDSCDECVLVEVDGDGDGVADSCDACPIDPNDDSDGDGSCDSDDACPGYNDNADADGDGTADGCDACPNDADDDADGDGVCGDVDACPGHDDNADFDGDGTADGCDETATGDASLDFSDMTEGSVSVSYDSNVDIYGFQFSVSGVTLTGASSDLGDVSFSETTGNVVGFSFTGGSLESELGTLVELTFTPINGGSTISVSDVVLSGIGGTDIAATGPGDSDVPACANADGDELCDVADDCPFDADNDADGDGVCGDVDPCPADANDDSDGDGSCDSDDACPNDPDDDADGDGVCGDVDPCPADANDDSDGDGSCDSDDACPNDADNDADGDGVCGDVDACPGYDDNADVDGDGTADGCDVCPNDADDDADGDGVCGDVDLCEGFDDSLDTDGDGIPNGCDETQDGDIILTWTSQSESHATLSYESNVDLYGFQLNVAGVDLTDAYDGVLDVQYSEATQNVIAFSMSGESLAAGSGTFVTFEFVPEVDGATLVLSDLLVVGQGGASLGVTDPGALVISPCANADSDNLCDVADTCMYDAENDADGDLICGNVDDCPYDAENDADDDGVCGDVDDCPYDAENDADADGICGDVDDCPYDADNDLDGDGVCGDVDPCPADANDDSDGDGSCDSDDACPNDPEDDADADGICGDEDACPYDAENDADSDGICGDEDACPYDAENDADADGICGDVDDCPYDADNDADADGVCGDEDVCPGFDDNADADSDGTADGCDVCPNDEFDDADADGVCGDVDQCEGFDDNVDTDGDAVADGCDVCAGGDDTVDTDSDGMPNDCDVDITLHSGNNLVSFHALPDTGLDVESFFGGSSVYQVIGQGEVAYDHPTLGWTGGLESVSPEDGYWLRSNIGEDEEVNFEVYGNVFGAISYDLAEGSNLLSYPFSITQSLSDAVPANAADVTYAIVGEGVAALNIGAWVGSLADNTTGGLRGGKGYWFATTLENDEYVSFEYNAPSGDVESREAFSEFSMPATPEGFEYTQSTAQGFYFVESASFDGIEASSGDWIVAYNDNVVVGSWPWSGAYTTVPAMGYDGSEETAGYMQNGQLPTFKLLRAEDGSLNEVSMVEPSAWTDNGVAIVQLSGSTPLPGAVVLNEAYPNPFNPSTNFSFAVPQDMHVNLSVYDINGRVVAELVNEMKSVNTYNVVWNANSNASGVYFVKLVAGDAVHTQKIMLIK